MYFSLWRYLSQPIGNDSRPFTLNPCRFWQAYKLQHLKRCLNNVYLEECWNTDYEKFVEAHRSFCDRTHLEEDPVWLIERCWHSQARYYHPDYFEDGYLKDISFFDRDS
ncbi:hypothetical protein IQ241_01555 [Romeria aff. gracilis LEGE 07310]|uniref:Uncharacterized protein n=1 Tax=Vasconcelosia minhoensis LEGE 07310 TaxID=915328 RepID=A0A8J7A4D2_9CYAN|nr:hypothetical protein [Romeria aff. gracilis LEGE 07310]